nr:hypothetical protein GCM10020185_19520 [Pseudomonas brassicacearum subsp. brassicacearum]
MIRLETILTPGRSQVNAPGGSKKKALEHIANLIHREVPDLEMQDVFEALVAREKNSVPPVFGNGIAIPHCRLKGCAAPISALLHLETAIDFDAIDGAPVDLLFVLLVPEAATDAHLELLRQIASMLDRKEVREKNCAAHRVTKLCTRLSWTSRTVIKKMRMIIVSGRSGSGKSTALNVLEDSGYYCIDNLPAGLLPELAERALIHTELAQPLVAVSIDARNLPSHLSRFPELLEEVRSRHIQCDVLYLDADEETLLKRFFPKPAGATH